MSLKHTRRFYRRGTIASLLGKLAWADVSDVQRLRMALQVRIIGQVYAFQRWRLSSVQLHRNPACTCPQVANGLQRLHNAQPHPIVHGDLKCANVLIEDNGDGAVIADFGLARAVREAGGRSADREQQQRGCGALTVTISPPEVLADTRAPRGPSVDVYAMGVVLYEMVTGRTAFAGMRQHEVVSTVRSGGRPVIPSSVNSDVAALIADCWAQDADARPTAGQVVTRLNAVIKQLTTADTLLTTTVADDTVYGLN
jgi:serine/threonine protein kinase